MTSVPVAALFLTARDRFHAALKEKVLRLDGGVLSIANKRNKTSKGIAFRINRKIGGETRAGEIKSQKAENEFEVAVAQFICETFVHLQHLRPGPWRVQKGGGEPEKPHEAAWKDELAIDLKQPTGIAGPKSTSTSSRSPKLVARTKNLRGARQRLHHQTRHFDLSRPSER